MDTSKIGLLTWRPCKQELPPESEAKMGAPGVGKSFEDGALDSFDDFKVPAEGPVVTSAHVTHARRCIAL